MQRDEELAQRVELALTQSKTVERETRYLKQMLGGIRDHLKLQAQGDPNGTEQEEVGR